MASVFEIAKRNTKQRDALANWATQKGTKLSDDELTNLHGFKLFGLNITTSWWDSRGEGIYKDLATEDGNWYYVGGDNAFDLGISTHRFKTAQDVFNYVSPGQGVSPAAKKYAGEQSQKTKQAKDSTAVNLLNQRLDQLGNVISGSQEQSNLRIESAFNKLSDILQSIQSGSQSPSVIQTLYLDRQAKTFLPTSIRDRGLAGALSAGQGNVG